MPRKPSYAYPSAERLPYSVQGLSPGVDVSVIFKHPRVSVQAVILADSTGQHVSRAQMARSNQINYISRRPKANARRERVRAAW